MGAPPQSFRGQSGLGPTSSCRPGAGVLQRFFTGAILLPFPLPLGEGQQVLRHFWGSQLGKGGQRGRDGAQHRTRHRTPPNLRFIRPKSQQSRWRNCLSTRLCLYALGTCLIIYHLSIYQSVCPSSCVSVSLSIYLSMIYPSI